MVNKQSLPIITQTTSWANPNPDPVTHTSKIKVGLVQINNSFSEQSYLPLSIGFLLSYAKQHVYNIKDFEFIIPIYKRISINKAVEHLAEAKLVAFSVYVWNFRISCLIAEELKNRNPDVVILFGGCHVPDNVEELEKFMMSLPYVDIACPGEGEIPFASVLSYFHLKDWSRVPSVAYFYGENFRINPPAHRIEDLNDIPSPFLNGTFDPLIEAYPDENWIGLWETNRGCPFSCAFCDWGTGAKKRMSNYDLDRLFKEIDWFSQHKVQFVYCCDANFGMYKDRDSAIAMKYIENKERYGYPEALSVQNTKNSTEASYNIQKMMTKSGLSKGVLLAFQSLHKPTLEAVKRSNIKLEAFYELQRRFTSEGVETFSDIILGLPEETYETFIDGVSTLMEMGQHNRIQFNNLSILPNAEMGDKEYQKKYGIELVESKMINVHGSLEEWVDNIYETQQMVTCTRTLSKEDWVKCRVFAYMIALLHFDKILQIPLIMANVEYGISYKDIIASMIESDTPVLAEITEFFTDMARDIQNGGFEFYASKEWLNIWWPADEFIFIKLMRKGILAGLYKEASFVLSSLLYSSGASDYEVILDESLMLNESLIKIPFVDTDMKISLSHNIWDIYRANLIGEKIEIEKGVYTYTVDRSSDTWMSWDDWYRRVVWFGNKKGAYLYKLK